MAKISLLLLLVLVSTFAAALTIEAPSSTGSPFNVTLTANGTADAITYTLTPGGANGSCSNCSTLNGTLTLAPGAYVVDAFATHGNETENASTNVTVIGLDISILDPDATTYDSSYTLVNLQSTLPARIIYTIDDNQTLACENCDSYNATVLVSPGNHTITANATRGIETASDVVVFSIASNVSGNGTANQTNTTNTTGNATNQTNASNYTLTVLSSPNGTLMVNGTSYGTTPTTISLVAGVYLVSVNATNYTTNTTTLTLNANTTLNLTLQVANSTNGSSNQTNQTNGTNNHTGRRYTGGLNKLPQALAAGEITDEELAALIRNSSLNPGVLNRLIKTGKLGNASLTAIIETQDAPPGIWRKLGGWFGFRVATPKERIVDKYTLTTEQQEKLLTEPITPAVKQRVAADKEKQAKVPPGQAKKQERESTDDNEGKHSEDDRGSGETEERSENDNEKSQGRGNSAKDASDNDSDENEDNDASNNGRGNSEKIPPGQAKKANR